MTTPAVTPPAGMDFEQMAAADAKSNAGTAPATASPTLPAAGMDFEQMAQQDAAKAASTTTAPHVPSSGEVLTDVLGGGPSNPLNTNAVNTALSQGMSGAIKSGGETAHTLGAVAGKLMPNSWRDALGLPSSFKQPDYLQSTSGAEIAGKVADNIAEFALSDEALKGLALAKRLGIAQKLHSMAESSPYIAKILEHGLTAIRGGAATVPQQMAHGATLTEALKTGATAAGVGAGVGAVSEGVQALKPLAADVVQGEKVAQTPAQAAMKTAAGATRETPLRESLTAPIEAAEKNADALYKQIDDVSGTDFKGLGKKLKNANLKIRMSVNPTDEAAWEAKRSEIEDTLAEAKQTAADAGVDPKTLDQADAQFKKMSAITDVEKKVFKNVNVIDPTTGDVNVNAAVKELQKLQDSEKYGSSRLEQAGDEYTKLLEDMKAANRLGIKALKRQDLAKLLLKGTAAGAALVGGGHILHALGE